MDAHRRPVPDRVLELFALGELPAPEAAALEARLAREEELAARLRALQASNQEILARHPAPAVAREVARRAQAGRAPRPWRPLLLAAGTAAAGVLAVTLVAKPGPAGEELAGERIKGARPHLLAAVVRGGGAEQLSDGAAVAPGDSIQLAYAAAGLHYGVIVSLDGRGVVTLHWPESPGEPARLQPGSPMALPHAFQLDDAPGFERFILVAASEPVDVGRVLEAARAAARAGPAGDRPLDLPRSWIQTSLQLRKVAP